MSKLGSFMKQLSYLPSLTEQDRQIFDYSIDMAAEIEPYTMALQLDGANQSVRFNSSYKVKTSFRSIFEQKALPFVSKYFSLLPYSDSYEEEEPEPKSFK